MRLLKKKQQNTTIPKAGGYKKYIKAMWSIYFLLLAGVATIFFCIALGIFGFMPSFEELENPQSNLASEVYSADQEVLGKYFIENRSNVHYEDISPNMVKALIATEDIRFYEHSGVDIRALLRVIYGIATGNYSGGGSTITQQLAKNLFPRPPQTKMELIIRKFKEWVIAIKLERNYTKEEVIAMYLNTVDFGSQSFGIKSAAKTFFGKTPATLNQQEAATLVGLLKAPTKYSPMLNPGSSLARRNVVLSQMEKYEYIKPNEYDSLKKLPINMDKYHVHDHNSGLATYFREYLRGYLTKWCKKHTKPDGTNYNLYKDGLKIYTTINSKMQKYAEEAVREHLANDLQPAFFNHWKGYDRAPFGWDVKQEIIDMLMEQGMKRSGRYKTLKRQKTKDEKIKEIFQKPVKMKVFTWQGDKDTVMSPWDSIRYYKFFLQTGMMSMEPQTGYIRAWVGGINYNHFKYDHVKQSKRQVGSTFKPFVYVEAMDDMGYTPCTKIANIPVTIELADGTTWQPSHSGKDEIVGEMITLKKALALSLNYVTARLMKEIGPHAVVEIAKRMGIESELPVVYSLCLGSADLSVYEMVGALNTFANKGLYIEPVFLTRIEDKMGNVIETFTPETNEAVNEITAYKMIELLKGVVQSGTGSRLRHTYNFTNPIAGKTGTSNNNSDGWFIGLTPDLVSGIWVGCQDRAAHFRSTSLGQGANMSLPIWAIYMKKIYEDKSLNISNGDFDRPPGLNMEFDCEEYEEEEQQKRPDDIFKDDGFNSL